MRKSADSSQDLHPLLHERWSPRAFDANAQISPDDITAILEAGRWSPSSNNFQPWRFLIGKRGGEKFKLITESLVGYNKQWAPRASAMIVIAGVMINEKGEERTQSLYDCGIASANMSIEAIHRGYVVHQIGGFDRDRLRNDLLLDVGINPIAILVIGKQAKPESLDSDELIGREVAPRSRRPLSELILALDI